MSGQRVNVGVLASSRQSLNELRRLVEGAGFAVEASVEFKGSLPVLPVVDVWVANLDLHDANAEALIDQLDQTGVPVIYDDDIQPSLDGDVTDSTDYLIQKRERQLGCKLRQLVREPAMDGQEKKYHRAQYVWVLGASTGGPEAVTQFLKGIPADLTRVAFIYVQHTENHAITNLRQVMARHSHWRVELADIPRVVREKTVYMVSPAQQVELLEAGVLSPINEPWSGPFRPSIDQVIAKVARVYGARGGAIIFSGMGDDGAKSCSLLYHRGGRVWSQLRSTCTVDSMPASVEGRGCVAFSAAPGELAQRLVSLHKYGTVPPQLILGHSTL